MRAVLGIAVRMWMVVGASVAAVGAGNGPAVTIYNQNFGVVREYVPLDLKAGVNEVRSTEITAHVEPDSVMLRDPAGKHALQILEQNYRADPISQGLLLNLFEGKTIDFVVADPNDTQRQRIVRGKIVRSGYVPHTAAFSRYGQEYAMRQTAMAYGSGYSYGGSDGGAQQPIVELDGQLRFGLPGTPLFPSLGDDTILKPTLAWRIETDTPGKFDAELSYVTGGMSWRASYNAVAPEEGDTLDLIGWVTVDNQTGKTFREAQLKLMAGDVNKIQNEADSAGRRTLYRDARTGEMRPVATEKSFDEYHLYTVARPTTLRDRETKQIEFVRAEGVKAPRIYVYDGANLPDGNARRNPNVIKEPTYGTQSNTKVWTMRELAISAANRLGLPLPAGRMRFYTQDSDARLEFVGENNIDHTPKDELLRIYTGNAFDLVGERKRVDFSVDHLRNLVDESFEIKVRNHKKDAVEIRIVEHLYRWTNWEIRENSDDFIKTDAQTIEFRVSVPADGERVVTYLVHYWW